MHRLTGNAPHHMYAESETERVHVIRKRLEARAVFCARKAVFGGHKPAVAVHCQIGKIVVVVVLCVRLVPLYVAHDIFPAVRLKILRHIVGVFFYLLFGYSRAEAVPAVPAERRNRKSFFHPFILCQSSVMLSIIGKWSLGYTPS